MDTEIDIQKPTLFMIGVIWVGYALLVRMGITTFMWGITLLILGYFLFRLVQEIKRLADATEKIAEQSNYSVEND